MRHPVFVVIFYNTVSFTQWQAQSLPGEISRRAGFSVLQISAHSGQRVWNGQSAGGFAGLGKSPVNKMGAFSPSAAKAAENSALV